MVRIDHIEAQYDGTRSRQLNWLPEEEARCENDLQVLSFKLNAMDRISHGKYTNKKRQRLHVSIVRVELFHRSHQEESRKPMKKLRTGMINANELKKTLSLLPKKITSPCR